MANNLANVNLLNDIWVSSLATSPDGVLFVERSSELLMLGKPKPFGGGVVKASLNRAISRHK